MIRVSKEVYDSLPKTHKTIYDFLEENYANASFLSIQELSKEIGVSSASVTRFAKAVGFSGYPALQKEVQKSIKEEFLPMKNVKSSIQSAEEDDSILQKTIRQNADNLEALYNKRLTENFSAAVEILSRARKIFIIGMRSSFCVAYYLSFMLSQFMDNIVLLESYGELFDKIFFSSAEDVLVAISFKRYTRLTIQVARHFHSQNSPIIAVTDAISSPLAPYAKSTLIAPNDDTYSFVSAITVLNALVVGVGARNKERVLKTMSDRESLLFLNKIYR
jgi:DNA-binding MurR/RpiR family transcriptional regulator